MEHLAPHCIVEIENRRFDSWRGEDLMSSSVELTTDKTGEGVVELLDPDFKIVDGFLGGGAKALQARFWYGWEIDLGASLFVGILARAEWSDGATTLRFHDFSAKMKQSKKTRYHKKKSDLKILKDLAAENELNFVLKPNSKSQFVESQPFDSIMQSSKTDWELALKTAERAGLRLYVRGDTLFAVQAGKTGEPSATLNFGKDFTLLRGFNLSYKLPDNKKGKPKKTEVRLRGKSGKQMKGLVQPGQRGLTDVVIHEDLPNPSVAIATKRAAGKTNRTREYAFEHQLKTMPTFQSIIEVRDTLTLAGMGRFYSGNHLVTDIRYNFRPGDLNSEITVGRDILK